MNWLGFSSLDLIFKVFAGVKLSKLGNSAWTANSVGYIQSNLVISNSLISNYRLSRIENLVPVLTWNYDNR